MAWPSESCGMWPVALPIVAGAITSGPLDRQAELIRRVHGAGADAVAISVCQLAGQDEDDQVWIERAGRCSNWSPPDIRLVILRVPLALSPVA